MIAWDRPLYYVLDAAGEPQPVGDALTWAHWFETADAARHVALDLVGDVRISTVFTSIDHNFSVDGPPILWESLVFGGPLHMEQRRYCSKADALIGHAELVEDVRAAAQADEGAP